MSAFNAELRDLVRSLVIAALERAQVDGAGTVVPAASNSGVRRLLLVFMSREPVAEEFFSQIGVLASQGYTFAAAFSHSFEQINPVEEVLRRLPAATPTLSSTAGERELLATAAGCAAVLCPGISSNTAVKVAQGIDDSLPSLLVRDALLGGRPVFVARNLPDLERELAERFPAASPALLRSSVDAGHRVQAAGVRFVPAVRLAAEVAAAFHQPVNDTPARLARTKPSVRRVFITAEDIYIAASSGQKELPHPPDAVITDAAREEAAARGIALVAPVV